MPPYIFVVKSAKLIVKRELPFLRGFKSRRHIGYHAGHHAVVIVCADRAE